MAIHFCTWHTMSFFSPHFSAQPSTFRDSQAGWRPWSDKSWELGIRTPLKPEGDFVLAISLKLIKSCQSCEATKLLLYSILCVQEMLCFSGPLCVRLGGCGCDFQAWFLCQCETSPSTSETLRAYLTIIFVRNLCNSECARLTTEVLVSIWRVAQGWCVWGIQASFLINLASKHWLQEVFFSLHTNPADLDSSHYMPLT